MLSISDRAISDLLKGIGGMKKGGIMKGGGAPGVGVAGMGGA